jgi:hypothetical protein
MTINSRDRTQELREKCRSWGINPRLLPVLKLVFIQNWKVSQASRTHGYNSSYVATVIRRLRADGIEPEIRETLARHEEENLRDLEGDFWQALRDKIRSGDVKALELYARIKGLIQRPAAQHNLQLNQYNIQQLKAMIVDEEGDEEDLPMLQEPTS